MRFAILVLESFELCSSKYEMHRSLFTEGIFQCQCALKRRYPNVITRPLLVVTEARSEGASSC